MDKKIPLHALHESLGAKLIPFAGFIMPVRYSSDLDEHMTVRNHVGIFDVSHMGEFLVKGKGALGLIQRVTSNDASKLMNGQAQYSCLPNDKGGIVDDLLVYKIEDESYMLVVNASNIDKDWNWIQSFNAEKVMMENVSEQTSLFAVQGPKANAVLQKLTAIELASIPYYHFRIGKFANVDNVVISHTGYTGAGGFEIYVPNAQAEHVWNAIMQAGSAEGIKPIGLGARDTLRLEKGFCLYGNDIDDTTSPIEAGLGWITKFTKKFTNYEAIQQQKEKGVSKKLVGFVLNEKGIPRHGYELKNKDGIKIGHVTSGTISPVLQKGIGMGYVETAYSALQSEIFVDIRGKLNAATVVKLPFL